MQRKLNSETLNSYLYLIKWVAISLISGIVGVATLQTFTILSNIITTNISNVNIHIIVWPISGAIITGLLIYRFEIGAAGEGVPSYIKGVKDDGGYLSFRVSFFKFFAALFTLSTYGNGGIVGPLGRVSAGISNQILGLIKPLTKRINQDDIRIAAVCGMSAIMGAIFHSSIGAGVFAVEIIQRKSINYRDLFPSILASSTAVYISKLLGFESFYGIETVNTFMEFDKTGWLIIFIIVVGFMGGLYNQIYGKITHIIRRGEGNILPKLILGSLVAFIISYAVNPNLIGTSKPIFTALYTGDITVITGRLTSLDNVGFSILIIIIAKILSNCITVGSGMSAGFTGPSALTGMLLGVAATTFLDIEIGSATYFAFMAAGFSGMLSSSMNVPLAAAILSIEIFGLQYSFPAAVSAIIGFQIMRGSTIYDFALGTAKK
ncbi:MAG: chloride channel protein [Spirochaetaceae bacterium]